ncbi:helix-turn-helix transcriptional regulator [Erwinia persicina]|uniref:AlpA family phage regulatory protein n=1 Tax=Erwinia persicina TaxID=55211 RepID=A0A4U3FKE0_9GAMM|nr:helix-turn-helix domain-containing protein [Erwinia persicina]TKJ94563.1 AlpA family phage regulatory protein [Erwinia persicina]
MTRLIGTTEVCSYLSCGKTFLYDLIKRGEFPKPLKLGSRSKWREEDIENYINYLSDTQSRNNK